MDISKILKEALNFFLSQWKFLFILTFPIILVETSLQTWLMLEIQGLDEKATTLPVEYLFGAIAAFLFLFYMYSCLTVYMHQRSYHDDVSISKVWMLSWRYVPYLMMAGVLSGMGILLLSLPAVLSGFLPLLLLSLWLIVRLAYVNFFIVIEHMTPLNAVRASFDFTKDRFWSSALIFSLLFCFASISGAISSLAIEQPIIVKLFLDSGFSFIALLATIAFFRIYMVERGEKELDQMTQE